MFIKKTTQKYKDTSHYTFKIVEAYRTSAGPRQRMLLNLGKQFDIPEAKWGELVQCIEDIIHGQTPLFVCPPEIESRAIKYARKIIENKGESLQALPKKEVPPADYETIDINSLESEAERSVGAEHVVYETIKKLGLDQKLTDLGFNGIQQQTAIGVIAGRLISPGSERSTHHWLQNLSAIDELLETSFGNLSLDRVYKNSDLLFKQRDAIEEYFAQKQRTLFNLEERVILYDLTNTFFEGTGKYNDKARFGRSKERRSDFPLVTLGLVIDSDGFPKRSKVFEGNISEPKTLEGVIADLRVSSSVSQKMPVIVMDAGIATESNIAMLKEQGYDYLVVSRKMQKEIPAGLEKQMVTVKEDGQTTVKAVATCQDGETIVYCHSTGKEKKEEGIRTFSEERLEKELQKVHLSLSKKHGIKQYEKVIERIGRIKEKCKRISNRYEIGISKDDSDMVTNITWQKKDRPNTSGVYALRTNKHDFKEQEAWNTYTMLTDIEDAFRCCKSELGLRPIHHQTERRVDGHIFITVIAYHILHTIRYVLRLKGIHLSWSTIRENLSSHRMVSTTFRNKDGQVIHVRKAAIPNPFHKQIYQALEISIHPGKTTKTIV